ncbi:DNA-directed RNA polymerase II [Burkholderia contaminans]|nr:DNA-directed RNA polymerase II [Burkholderia contaminans]
MPDVALEVTDDWPPIEIESCAVACAPAVELLPIAVEPAPDASV